MRVDKKLLIFGILAGFISPLVVILQVITREGFNLAVHPLSLLSLGDLGWIQISNFILTGFFYLVFSVGIYKTLENKRGRKISFLLGFYGAVLILAGIFTVDPMLGFPPGSPEGLPAKLSWHAQLHNLTFLLAFLAMIFAQFLTGRYFLALNQKKFALFSFFVCAITPIAIIASQIIYAFAGYILFFTGLMVNVWVIMLAVSVLRQIPPLTYHETSKNISS